MKKTLRKLLDMAGIWRMYTFQGHIRWTGFFMSLFNFSVIIYSLFLVELLGIGESVDNYMIWIVSFLCIYFVVAPIFGYLDTNRGTFKAQQKEWLKIDPIWIQINEKLDKTERDNQELKQMIRNLEQRLEQQGGWH